MRVYDGIIGKRVQANWGANGGRRATGIVIGYRTEPTVIIEEADGTHLYWAASLTELEQFLEEK